MPKLADKLSCCGCAACVNKCAVGAITMEADGAGFKFPTINNEKCVECGACSSVCPALYPLKPEALTPDSYVVQHKDEEIRRQSTSGGAFTAIAAAIIKEGGVVFGASYVDDFYLHHIPIENYDDLKLFRNSKYVPSDIGDTYKKTNELLKDGRKVCFSGTPCQIQGLLKYLGSDDENLITVDFICHCVPSPEVFHKYLSYQKAKYPEFSKLIMRDKTLGYSYSTIALFDKNDKCLYRKGSEYDPWMRLFLSDCCDRPSCYECKYQTGNRPADITLWDGWNTHILAPEFDDNKGTTNVVAWSKKGQDLISEISDTVRIRPVDIENFKANLTRKNEKKPPKNSAEFYLDLERLDDKGFLNKYAPVNSKVIIKTMIRKIMFTLHLHDAIRNIVHKLRLKKKAEGK